MSKYKYYSLNNIKKKNATYNVIFGERSNGKTYAVLKEALKLFKDEGKQFAYVRRWQTDIRGRRSQAIFSALEANGEIEKIFNGQYTGSIIMLVDSIFALMMIMARRYTRTLIF